VSRQRKWFSAFQQQQLGEVPIEELRMFSQQMELKRNLEVKRKYSELVVGAG
jgi:hypothetical protein